MEVNTLDFKSVPPLPDYSKRCGIIMEPPPVARHRIGDEWVDAHHCPNWFHRTMQRWILGIHWQRIDR